MKTTKILTTTGIPRFASLQQDPSPETGTSSVVVAAVVVAAVVVDDVDVDVVGEVDVDVNTILLGRQVRQVLLLSMLLLLL